MYDLPWMNAQAKALLAKAEQHFLSKEADFEYRGVRFDLEGPHIRFDFSGPGVWIELSPSAQFYPNQAQHQIAHEVIHLLAPNRSPPTIMLEEGLAVWFSVHGPDFVHDTYKAEVFAHLSSDEKAKNYRDALALYNELSSIDPEAIKNLRAREPKLHALSPNLIREVLPHVDADLAERLCERRKMR